MPISEAVAKTQLKRFVNFAQFPETEAAIEELLKAFMVASRDEEDAKDIGDCLMRTTHEYCPKPAHVYDAADAVHRGSEDPAEFFTSVRRPGDEPFNGLADLIDDRLLELLRRKAESARTYAERNALKQFIAIREDAQQRRQLPAPEGGGANA